ncbi:MAG TPA: CheR family methyltransferase [Verrucomicrobiae bacterium]
MNLEAFSAILQRSSGLQLDTVGRQGVQNAIEERCRRLGLEKPEDYLQMLEQDGEERQRLVEVAVIPETWFWRDPKAFEALSKMAVERIAQKPNLPVRVLSIPCSTGEEAYTIVAALTEAGLTAEQFVVDAVDISRNSLLAAQAALYRAYSFRNVPEVFHEKYFKREGDCWRLTAEWRQAVRFRQGNLLTMENFIGTAPYDFIFCRNLLIYFSREDQARALKNLTSLLQPEGVFFAGPGEGGVMMSSGFHPLRMSHAFAFRRMSAAEARNRALADGAPVPASPQKPAPSLVKARAAQTTRLRQEVKNPPARPTASPHPSPEKAAPATVEPILEQVRKMADTGDATGAEEKLRAMLAGGSNDPDAFYLMGLLQDVRGDAVGAITSYRKVLYLAPDHHEAMTHLALLLESRGDHAEAERLHGRAARIQKKTGARSATRVNA